jgi:hypothetical protein
VGGENATGGVDGACVCADGIGREAIVPVANSDSASFAGIVVATGPRTVSARPSVKLNAPTATAMAAAAKTVILRITLFPRTQKLSQRAGHDHAKLVKIRFGESGSHTGTRW